MKILDQHGDQENDGLLKSLGDVSAQDANKQKS
jgi:hypothetical protein